MELLGCCTVFFPVVQRGVDAIISQLSLGTKFFQEHGAGICLPRCSVLAFAGHLHHHRVEVDKRDAMLMAVPHGQWRWGYVQRRALALEAAAGAAEGRTTRERAVGVRWPRPADLILMEIQVINCIEPAGCTTRRRWCDQDSAGDAWSNSSRSSPRFFAGPPPPHDQELSCPQGATVACCALRKVSAQWILENQ